MGSLKEIWSVRFIWFAVQIFIGTAPPRTTLQNPNYAENLRVWQASIQAGRVVSNPLLDWDEESQTSRSIRELEGWVETDDGVLPGFINHYSDIPSDNYQGLNRNLSLEATMAADRNVRTSIQVLRKDVIVMFGARPTRMFPRTLHHGYFFANVWQYIRRLG